MQLVQSDEDKKQAEAYCKKQESMEGERSTWEAHWQECLDFIVPRKNDVITTRTPGDKRTELFDTTAIMANQLLAGALHSMLTNPATRFFDLTMGDPNLDDIEEVKSWLQDVGELMFQQLNKSNFQTEVHEIYIDEGAIGTACLWMGEHDERVIHFGARPMKEIFVDENNLGLIDVVHRKFKWKLRQIVQEWGENKLDPQLIRKYKDGCEDDFEIIHAVHPEDEYEGKAHKFRSCYILKEFAYKISTGGFHEFPYAVPRWTKTSGEKYGRGPGMDMLADIKMVDRMMETTIQGAQKTINPPLMVPDDGVIGRVRLTPGGLTVVRPGEQYAIKPLLTDPRIDFGYQAVEDVRKRIRAGFYVDQLQLNEGPQMTATEVMQRTEEKLRLMGPVLGRQNFEFLSPLVERLFGIMNRRGMLPPAPRQIQGKSFEVRYSSLVARAQRMSEGQNLARAIGVAAPIVNAAQSALDLLDTDMAFKYIMDIYGVPHKIMRKMREVKEIREARAEAQAKMAAQSAQAHEAEMASKVMPGVVQLQQAQAQKGAA